MGFLGSSVGKEFAYNAGDPISTLGLGSSPGEGIGYHSSILGLSSGSDSKESACNMRDLGSVPGLGRSPGGGHGQPTPVFLPGESPWTEEAGGLPSMGSQKVEHS